MTPGAAVEVRVLLFGPAREAAGAAEATLALPSPATAGTALAALAARWPALAAVLPRARVAVNRAYVDADASLAEGDEIAVIPPVGGG